MAQREPRPGDVAVSRDPRDAHREIEVYGVSDEFVYIRNSFRKWRTRRRNFARLYKIVGV